MILLTKGLSGVFSSLLQPHDTKASIFWCSAITVQLSQPYETTGKTIALTIQTFVGRVKPLLFNTLSRFVIASLPRSNCLLISCLQSLSAVILEPKKRKSYYFNGSIVHYIFIAEQDSLVWIYFNLFMYSFVDGHLSDLVWGNYKKLVQECLQLNRTAPISLALKVILDDIQFMQTELNHMKMTLYKVLLHNLDNFESWSFILHVNPGALRSLPTSDGSFSIGNTIFFLPKYSKESGVFFTKQLYCSHSVLHFPQSPENSSYSPLD